MCALNIMMDYSFNYRRFGTRCCTWFSVSLIISSDNELQLSSSSLALGAAQTEFNLSFIT